MSKLTTEKPNHCFNTENPNAQCSGQHLFLCLEKYSKQHNICLMCTSMMATCVWISIQLLHNNCMKETLFTSSLLGRNCIQSIYKHASKIQI